MLQVTQGNQNLNNGVPHDQPREDPDPHGGWRPYRGEGNQRPE